ncbi:invasion associated locus B family protein [Rosenbergiella australiborealis]|uniref:invasion associated locus B family protein n=1 Tax=Rosenbergiella australiborealis TaxID=1544696 RepID=UPI001F4D6C81
MKNKNTLLFSLAAIVIVIVGAYLLVKKNIIHINFPETTVKHVRGSNVISGSLDREKLPLHVNQVDEIYQNWKVECIINNQSACTLSSVKSDDAVHLAFNVNDKQQLIAEAFAPLGVDLRKGIHFAMSIKGEQASQHSTYLNCNTQGCRFKLIIPISIIDQFKAADHIGITYYFPENPQPTETDVSLSGFNDALSRLLSLYQHQ